MSDHSKSKASFFLLKEWNWLYPTSKVSKLMKKIMIVGSFSPCLKILSFVVVMTSPVSRDND